VACSQTNPPRCCGTFSDPDAERLRPAWALTGFIRADDVHRAQQSGFDAHIGKPLSIDQITATMQRLLSEKNK